MNPASCFTRHSFVDSAGVRLAFAHGGPAYVCLKCEDAFLRPLQTTDRRRTAVRTCSIVAPAAVNFERSTKTLKCSTAAVEDANGVSLGYCHPCSKTLQPSSTKPVFPCGSLIHAPGLVALSATVGLGLYCSEIL